MSRIVAASDADANGGSRRPATGRRSLDTELARRTRGGDPSPYVTRALLLWPRLDRSRLRRCADDPVRIAEVVASRTSQPFDAILAMLIRHVAALRPVTRPAMAWGDRQPIERGGLRVLRSIERSRKPRDLDDLEDLQPA